MNNYLYHFSPRKFEDVAQTVSTVKSIFQNGFFLSEETLKVNWKDVYAINGKERDITANQLRFCLTAITNKAELYVHAERFGLIGFEFEEDFIVKIGGFPVFYVPSPNKEDASFEEYKGISLLYRLGDAQEILEYIIKYNLIQTSDIDIENVLGAIKFLANVCYPTQRKPDKPSSVQIDYYNQREWRVIHGLTAQMVKIGRCQNNYTLEAFENKPIRDYITRVLVFEKQGVLEHMRLCIQYQVENLIADFNMNCKVEFVPTS
jgi:hypothetical protein